MQCCKSALSWWLWMGGSFVFGATAVAIALCWNTIFNALLGSMLVLSDSSTTYSRWVAPDQPLYFEVFFFNCTNAESFPTEKPKLEQIGPYRFREVRKHVNVTFHPSNSSVAYRTMRTWYYDNATSNGSLMDSITSLNMPLASTYFSMRYLNIWEEMFTKPIFNFLNMKMFVTKTAGELLFEGYEDPLVLLNHKLKLGPPDMPHPDRFGWFYGRNNSIDTDGYMEVTSGEGEIQVGQMVRWNHRDSLPFYQGNCSRIVGTAGEFVSRGLGNSSLTMFVSDLCRTIDFEHVGSGELNGLDYHKYEMSERCFDKSSVSEENTCFCNGECRWSGVMNVSACRFDTPSFLSLPHFLHADPSLRDDVDGMSPDPDKHSFYMSVEPTLGVPIDVAGRFQYNVYVDSRYFKLFNKTRQMLFPMFWVQQHVIVTDNIFKELRIVIFMSRYGGVVFAVMSIVVAAVALAFCGKRPKYISWTPASLVTQDLNLNVQTQTLLPPPTMTN